MEGETATYVEASIALTVKVRSMGFHRGMSLWRVSREASSNLGDLSASLQRVVIANKPKVIAMGNKRQESDLFIVLRDGRTDHMGKGQTVRLSEQSTHPIEKACLGITRMSRSLPKCYCAT